MNKAVRFFYERAGWSYDPLAETSDQGRRRCAEEMACHEGCARDDGFYFDWRESEEDSASFEDGPAPPHRLWDCYMFNEDGVSIAALCACDFGPDSGPHGAYRRVVEAEVASSYYIDHNL